MKKDTKIKMITFMGEGVVEVQYTQLVGDNSRGKFRVDLSEKEYYNITKNHNIEQHFDNK